MWNGGRKLQLGVEAQPVPQEATKSHKEKTTPRKKGWNVVSSKRGRGPTGDCQGSKSESPADP